MLAYQTHEQLSGNSLDSISSIIFFLKLPVFMNNNSLKAVFVRVLQILNAEMMHAANHDPVDLKKSHRLTVRLCPLVATPQLYH